uniref:uncharacterized protein YER152C-like isoform X1 n=1 Tax=Styela clava TaxID=7725 RepID=UPI00193A5D0E|nr:uncharacterized protein YER152C-like isoform X1 [Styela clava]
MAEFLNGFEESAGSENYNNKVLLQIGAPGPATLRDVGKIIKDATIQHFDETNIHCEEVLQYGCTSGNFQFKEELAKFLSSNYRNPVHSKDLFVNTGSSQGLHNLLSVYFQPGDILFVGDPTYWTLLDTISHTFDFKIVGIKLDENGMVVDDLEKYLEAHTLRPSTDRHPFRAVAYVMPVYHNPTTICLSEDRCRKLIKLARKYELMVVTDDVYNILTYSAPDSKDPKLAKPPTRMFYLDNKSDPDYKGNVISIGTFSKILCPGLRLGWFEIPHHVLERFNKILLSLSGNGRNPYTSAIVTAGLKSGSVQQHVTKLRQFYAEKMKHVQGLITTSLRSYGVKCSCPDGGIFLWVVLPEGKLSQSVLDSASNELSFITGDRCSFSHSHGDGMRICISFYEPDVLYPAIEKLCNYIKNMLSRKE